MIRPLNLKLLSGAGALSHNLGHYTMAKDFFEQSLDLSKDLQDQAKIAKALNNVSWAEWRIGNYELTVSYAEEALEIFAGLGDELGQASSLNNLAWACHYRGQFEKAAEIQQQILTEHIRLDNKSGIAFAKTNLARSLTQIGGRKKGYTSVETRPQTLPGLKESSIDCLFLSGAGRMPF